MKTYVGPDREHAELEAWETDAFTLIIESHTKPPERFQLSQALKSIQRAQGLAVTDGFQRCARQMWRPARTAGSGIC